MEFEKDLLSKDRCNSTKTYFCYAHVFCFAISYIKKGGTASISMYFYNCFVLARNISLILRNEGRLMVFENMVQRRIFGPKSDEVADGCRQLL
jgi:hypothetical protein